MTVEPGVTGCPEGFPSFDECPKAPLRSVTARAVVDLYAALHLHLCPIANCDATCGYDYGAMAVAEGLVELLGRGGPNAGRFMRAVRVLGEAARQ